MSRGAFGYFVAFSLGAVAGGVIAWRILKPRYEQLAKEEIADVKAHFSYRKDSDESPEEGKDDSEEEQIKPSSRDLRNLKNTLTNLGYSDYSRSSSVDQPKEVRKRVKDKGPYIIAPEEAGETDYDIVSLTYYADDVLTDDADCPIDNVDDVIGCDSLTHFGEYEDDSIYVRNDQTKRDYEVLFDQRNYFDVVKRDSRRSGAK